MQTYEFYAIADEEPKWDYSNKPFKISRVKENLVFAVSSHKTALLYSAHVRTGYDDTHARHAVMLSYSPFLNFTYPGSDRSKGQGKEYTRK